MKTSQRRSILCLILLVVVLLMTACAKTPEDAQAWLKDSRAPVKMKEFIQDKRNPHETKVEAVVVLIMRNNSPELPNALSAPLKTEELNRIVRDVIPRMQGLIDEEAGYATRVKDAAYYLLTLELNDENREALMDFIREWVDGDNFFVPMEKAGRVEHAKLFELLGTESLDIYAHALESKLNSLDEALEKEEKVLAEKAAKGESVKIKYRPSDNIVSTISTTLYNLNALKIPGADDMVAEMFVKRMDKYYPNIPRVYALPFASNTSEKLLPMAKRILSDPEYKNVSLNYFKDVMTASYYRNVQKKAGVEVCTQLIQSDRTGYTRWDCLELLTIAKGRDGFAPLLMSLPDDYTALATPADHPTFLATPSMTFWNSLRVYCVHLPQMLNNQVPLEVFRQLLTMGSKIDRILSMACLGTLGVESDVALLAGLKPDKTDMTEYGMQVRTLGELANYSSAILEKRLNIEKAQKENAQEAKEEKK